MIPRSYLYAPGDEPEKLEKAVARGADAVIADLEDAVPLDRKDAARETVCAFLRARDAKGPQVWVRVNGGALLEEDVLAVAKTGPDGISLPKASLQDLARLDVLLADADIPVSALIETAAGVLDARAIASSPRVTRLQIGEADLTGELHIEPSGDERELMPLRMPIILASSATGLAPPVGPVSTDFRDLDALRASTRALKALGFGARAAIHPAQVPVINEVFTPSDEEVARARRLLELFEAAGGGVCVDDDGRMVDEAVVRGARYTLALVQA